MNEAETRAEHIDPALKVAGWGIVDHSSIRREYKITEGRIETLGKRGVPLTADYVLIYRNTKLAVVEAKAWNEELTKGVGQAKDYASKMEIRFTYATNGQGIYQIDMDTGEEGEVTAYPTPEELWAKTFAEQDAWRDRFAEVPYEDKGGSHPGRYYQDIAIERVLQAIAAKKDRILLTLATGTGKTFIAFQIAWKLFHSRWNLSARGSATDYVARRPRILFLADRNILASQAYNAFSAFAEDALIRIKPSDIRKKGKVPKNGSIFFTIFQTFMAGPANNATDRVNPGEINSPQGMGQVNPGEEKDAPGIGQVNPGNANLLIGQSNPREEKAAPGFGQVVNANQEIGDPGEEKYNQGISAPKCYFGEYPPDFFDLIIIDECHRGGANDESNWRSILEYFKPAVQLGLTATPKRIDNADTYRYFGDPVFIYSLKEGINDGFLTPFKVKQISTTMDEYVYTNDDQVLLGEVEKGKIYKEKDFNRIIEIKEREKKRVEILLNQINQNEKTLVFCANQIHALAIRDLINQINKSNNVNYCQRVTADDGELGEQHLRDFQDNEKTIPTILTTSQKLSTGVDARNIRNIVLMRPINSMIEFKQIIGRGTRLFDGKDYFTIYDFVKAHHHFADEEWDGEPQEPDFCEKCKNYPCECIIEPPKPCKICGKSPCECKRVTEPCRKCGRRPCVCRKVRIKLADGKERVIQHMMSTTYWHPDGTPLSAQQFMEQLFGKLPDFFKNELELRTLWSAPGTRKKLLEGLSEKGFGKDQLSEMQKLIEAENSDIFDVLRYVAYTNPPETREVRANQAKIFINTHFNLKQQAFLDFVLQHYVTVGVEELDQEKLTPLLRLKYHNSIADALADLGKADEIGKIFVDFQQYLYETPNEKLKATI